MKRFLLLAALVVAACSSSPKPATTTTNTPQVVVTEAPISGESLAAFMKQRFPDQVASGALVLEFGSAGVDAEVGEELALMGITSTTQLAAIVPPDFQTKGFDANKAAGSTANIPGTIRDLLIIHDTRGYFEKAWGNKWSANGPEDFPAPAAYGVDFKVMEELGVFGGGGGEGEGEGEGE